MKGDQMGILAADPTQRELPLSNQTRFNAPCELVWTAGRDPGAAFQPLTLRAGWLISGCANGGQSGCAGNDWLAREQAPECVFVDDLDRVTQRDQPLRCAVLRVALRLCSSPNAQGSRTWADVAGHVEPTTRGKVGRPRS